LDQKISHFKLTDTQARFVRELGDRITATQSAVESLRASQRVIIELAATEHGHSGEINYDPLTQTVTVKSNATTAPPKPKKV
jgi:hypothetical protein